MAHWKTTPFVPCKAVAIAATASGADEAASCRSRPSDMRGDDSAVHRSPRP